MKQNTELKKKVDKKVLSFFLIGFPTVLAVFLALAPGLYWAGVVSLVVYQLILLKQFLDEYYQ